MLLTEGNTAKVIPSSMGLSVWLSRVQKQPLWAKRWRSTTKRKTGCIPEKWKKEEEKKWAKKKKWWKKENFHEKEQSKGGKTKMVLSIMPRNTTYVCQDNDGRHLTQWWSDGQEVELQQMDQWSLCSVAVANEKMKLKWRVASVAATDEKTKLGYQLWH